MLAVHKPQVDPAARAELFRLRVPCDVLNPVSFLCFSFLSSDFWILNFVLLSFLKIYISFSPGSSTVLVEEVFHKEFFEQKVSCLCFSNMQSPPRPILTFAGWCRLFVLAGKFIGG